MRILVTGSRDIPPSQIAAGQRPIWDHLLPAIYAAERVVIVEGGCPTGADLYARRMVNSGVRVHGWDDNLVSETHPADWTSHGKAAGPLRNKRMVELGADICFAFFYEGAGNRGTKNCADLAEAAGIPVRRLTVPKME